MKLWNLAFSSRIYGTYLKRDINLVACSSIVNCPNFKSWISIVFFIIKTIYQIFLFEMFLKLLPSYLLFFYALHYLYLLPPQGGFSFELIHRQLGLKVLVIIIKLKLFFHIHDQDFAASSTSPSNVGGLIFLNSPSVSILCFFFFHWLETLPDSSSWLILLPSISWVWLPCGVPSSRYWCSASYLVLWSGLGWEVRWFCLSERVCKIISYLRINISLYVLNQAISAWNCWRVSRNILVWLWCSAPNYTHIYRFEVEIGIELDSIDGLGGISPLAPLLITIYLLLDFLSLLISK